jgi:hypothetical protein
MRTYHPELGDRLPDRLPRRLAGPPRRRPLDTDYARQVRGLRARRARLTASLAAAECREALV